MMPSGFAEIVFNIPLDRTFHYRVPPSLMNRIAVAKRVRAPFGKTSRVGWCIGFAESSEISELKEISEVLDDEPLVDVSMLTLTRWMADYYLCSWGEALEAAVPAGVKIGRSSRKIPAVEAAAMEPLKSGNEKQRCVFEILSASAGPVPIRELVRRCQISAASVKTLIRKGVLRAVEVRPEIDSFSDIIREEPKEITLTPEQSDALERIRKPVEEGRHQTFLLYGVTGSGKTEVYLRAIEHVTAQGKQAIVLVPEIALTPQTVSRFKTRFPRTAVLHSTLTEGDRSSQWSDIRSGQADVVVGARSALFAPLPRLGLIVIDEEHETSYKQPNSPRYHAREAAIERARLAGASVILGTATPALETVARAESGGIEMIRLSHRIEHRPLPGIEIIDLSAEMAEMKQYPVISRRLKQLVTETLARGEQVILFQNRRGFTTYTTCGRCRWIMKCKRCDVNLTYHKYSGRAVCHHCMESIPLPATCPDCGYGGVRHLGIGTERIEEEMNILFENHRISRMDSDSMKTRDRYRESLGDLWSGETEVLVGTQITAKGLDVPNVTLVGVISADTAFHLPDFRAAERTFQLITQVAGRAGRGPKGGRVVVQTFHPNHYAIQCAARYDTEEFIRRETEWRRPLHYPPFGHLIRLLFHGWEEERVREYSGTWLGFLKNTLAAGEAEFLGPSPAPLYRIKGQYRMQILIKAMNLPVAQSVLRELMQRHRPSGTLRMVVDVDPVDMM